MINPSFTSVKVGMIGPVPQQWGGRKWLGGVATYVHGLLSSMVDEGAIIGLLADNTNTKSKPPKYVLPGNIKFYFISRNLIEIAKTGFQESAKIIRNIFRDPNIWRSIPALKLGGLFVQSTNTTKFVCDYCPDILHVHHAQHRHFVCQRILKIPKPLISTVHSVNIFEEPAPEWLRKMVAANYHHGDHFIAVSHFVKDRMISLGADKKKITVIPNGVDAIRFSPGSKKEARLSLDLPPDAVIFLFTGRFSNRKGVKNLLVAFHQFVQKQAAARLNFPRDRAPYRESAQPSSDTGNF